MYIFSEGLNLSNSRALLSECVWVLNIITYTHVNINNLFTHYWSLNKLVDMWNWSGIYILAWGSFDDY